MNWLFLAELANHLNQTMYLSHQSRAGVRPCNGFCQSPHHVQTHFPEPSAQVFNILLFFIQNIICNIPISADGSEEVAKPLSWTKKLTGPTCSDPGSPWRGGSENGEGGRRGSGGGRRGQSQVLATGRGDDLTGGSSAAI